MARMRAIAPDTTFSDHVSLEQRLSSGDTWIAEAREVERAEAVVQDQLGDGASGGGALLRTVSGEAVGEIEVRQFGMRADDGVVVERVVVVEAGPGVDDL